VFDHCWGCEKASLSVRILKRDVSFKISDVKICRRKLRVSEGVTRIWKERGEKLMTCHLFLDNFFLKFHDLCVVFKGWEFWNWSLFQENSDISNLISWNVRLFWISSFAEDVLLQKIDCVFVLAIRGLLHMTKNFVMWCDFRVFQSLLRNPSLWKVFLLETTLPWFLEMFWVANHGVVENMCSFSKSYL